MAQNNTVKNKEQAERLIVKLINRFDISESELLKLFELKHDRSTPSGQGDLLTKLFAYLGSVFFLGGLAALGGMFWESMNSFARVGILLIPGFIIYLMVVLNSGDNFLKRISIPLYILSFVLEIAGLFTFLYEYFEHSGRWERATLFVFGVLAIQQFFSFYAKKQTVMLFCTVCSFIGVLASVFEIVNITEQWSFTIMGISLMALTYAISTTPYKSIAGFWYFFAGIFCLGGLFVILEGHNIDFFILLPTCFLVYFSTFVKSKALLFVSIIALFAFLSYFTAEYFKDSLGWPIVLLLIGVLFFTLGYLGAKLVRKSSSG